MTQPTSILNRPCSGLFLCAAIPITAQPLTQLHSLHSRIDWTEFLLTCPLVPLDIFSHLLHLALVLDQKSGTSKWAKIQTLGVLSLWGQWKLKANHRSCEQVPTQGLGREAPCPQRKPCWPHTNLNQGRVRLFMVVRAPVPNPAQPGHFSKASTCSRNHSFV